MGSRTRDEETSGIRSGMKEVKKERRVASRVNRDCGLALQLSRRVLDPDVPRGCDGAWTDGLRACRRARAIRTGTGMEWRALMGPDHHRTSYRRPGDASWGNADRKSNEIRRALAGPRISMDRASLEQAGNRRLKHSGVRSRACTLISHATLISSSSTRTFSSNF